MSTLKKSISCLLILMPCLLSLCACQSVRIDTFPNPALIQAANEEVRLSILNIPSAEDFETDIVILLENQTVDDVVFPSDFGIRLFYLPRDNNEWLEIQNQISYLPEELRVLAEKNDPAHSKKVIDIRPNVEQTLIPGILRVIVLGNIMIDGQKTAQQVSAYIDIELSP